LTDTVLSALEACALPHGLGRRVERDALPVSGGPWVLRLDGFAHKASAGAIRLGLSAAELPAAHDALRALAREHEIEPRIRLAPMFDVAEELVVALWRDPTRGSGCILGRGGGDVEELRDVAVARLPRSEADVIRVLSHTSIGRRLLEDASLDGLPGFIVRLTFAFHSELSWVRELECNPVALTAEGPVILDVMVTI
jgi:acetyltransferase